MNIYTPPFEIPEEGLYLWDWFNDLNNSISRIDFNGCYVCISPSDFLAWSTLTRNYLYPEEYDILKTMDKMYCNELNAEIKAKRNKQEEAHKREIESAKNKRR